MRETDKLLEQLRIVYDVAKIEDDTGTFSIYRRYDDGDIVEDSGWHPRPQKLEPNAIFVEAFPLSRKLVVANGGNFVHLKDLDKNTLHAVCPNGKEVLVCEICEYGNGYTADCIELIRLITRSNGEHGLAICKRTMSSSRTTYRWYIVSEDGVVRESDLF